MGDYNVFVSVGATATEKQEIFVRAVEERLRSEGINPHTVGRNTFSAVAPFEQVTELLDKCRRRRQNFRRSVTLVRGTRSKQAWPLLVASRLW